MEALGSILIPVLLNIAALLVIGIIGWLMKRSINQIDKRLAEGDKKFEVICKDVGHLKENRGYDREYFAKEYVSKEDYLRVMTSMEKKLDDIAAVGLDSSKRLTRMEEKISKLEESK